MSKTGIEYIQIFRNSDLSLEEKRVGIAKLIEDKVPVDCNLFGHGLSSVPDEEFFKEHFTLFQNLLDRQNLTFVGDDPRRSFRASFTCRNFGLKLLPFVGQWGYLLTVDDLNEILYTSGLSDDEKEWLLCTKNDYFMITPERKAKIEAPTLANHVLKIHEFHGEPYHALTPPNFKFARSLLQAGYQNYLKHFDIFNLFLPYDWATVLKYQVKDSGTVEELVEKYVQIIEFVTQESRLANGFRSKISLYWEKHDAYLKLIPQLFPESADRLQAQFERIAQIPAFQALKPA